MKKYFLWLTGMVLIAILSISFTLKSWDLIETNKQVSYYWFIGTTWTGHHNSHSVEVIYSGCPYLGLGHCGDGYTESDLKDISDPSKGLNTYATIKDFIRYIP